MLYLDSEYVEELEAYYYSLCNSSCCCTCLAACEYRCNAGVIKHLATFVGNPDCIKQDEVCDGRAFCADGQDEIGCGKCSAYLSTLCTL
jgi:hypothetical protein